jgi:DNA repair ATPase RecN
MCCWVLIISVGCDAFVRKFTRKPKKENVKQEEMVLVPEEYKPTADKTELYRQYFLYWQTWHEELLESLLQNKSLKKRVDCAQEALKNLSNLRPLLGPEKQQKLDNYINQLVDLKASIAQDTYGTNSLTYRDRADRIKRGILRDFSYRKVSKDIA